MLDLTVSGLLLDMDGTLVDSTALVEALWTEFAARHGLDLARILSISHGRPSLDTVRDMLPDAEPEEQQRERDRIEAAGLLRTDGIVEVPGAAAFLHRVETLELPVAIVTSAPRDLAAVRFDAAGVPLPELAVTADDITAGKPDPQPFVLGAQLLGIRPGACAAFEDSAAGLAAARTAGAAAVVVGDYEGPETVGVPRIRDWRGVAIERTEEGFRIREDAG
ncbi:HAD-IA family hydrolase [Gulosibacter sp. 10]|uniref:HAD-IA family hydrolase n=1 Tax=Gulosibacter sp. 10 TaxID=1255570 RepID=UPI00097EC9C7|nr:HAD-IA family hydrolase [Gulosibacter sp. 10]SJM59108.1 Putative phosphatase YfbT [Gulosibacter sp. 10]